MARRDIKIIRSPSMSAPSLAKTAIRLAASTKKKIGLPAMSAPLLVATADGELDNENYWLACNVCTLVGRDRHSACRVNKQKKVSSSAMSAPSLAATADGELDNENWKVLACLRCLRPRWP